MTSRGDGLPINLSLDDLGPVPPLDVSIIKRAQLNAADMLGYECGEILDMLGIKYRTEVIV